MPTLTCTVSETIMRALRERQGRTGESLSHIVASSLADALEVEHVTLFQASIASALVKGVFDGLVTIGELKQHGDFGLGTFDGLDGEMLALDSRFYHVQATGLHRGRRPGHRPVRGGEPVSGGTHPRLQRH